jgi:hypothetical protein
MIPPVLESQLCKKESAACQDWTSIYDHNKTATELGVVAYSYNPSTQEAEVGES